MQTTAPSTASHDTVRPPRRRSGAGRNPLAILDPGLRRGDEGGRCGNRGGEMRVACRIVAFCPAAWGSGLASRQHRAFRGEL